MKNFSVLIIFMLITSLVFGNRLQIASIGDLKTVNGKIIKDCKVGYQLFGKLKNAKTNGVLFPTWFSGTTNDLATGTKPWQFIDTTKFCLILVDALGNGLSSSPSNSVNQHGPLFPEITVEDMVNSQYVMLTKYLGIKHLRGIFGISMGGFQAFQWAVSYPDFAERISAMIGTPQLTSSDLINMTIVKTLMDESAAFNHGNYKTNPAIPLASLFFTINLGTPIHTAKTIPHKDTKKYIDGFERPPAFDWNNFYAQLQAVMAHNITRPYNNSLAEAAKRIKAKMLIAVNQQDHTVNPLPAIEISKLLSAKLYLVNDELGHNGVDYNSAEFKAMAKELLETDL